MFAFQPVDVTAFVRVSCLLLSLLESTSASLTVLTLNSSRMARELQVWFVVGVFVDSQNRAWIYISTCSKRRICASCRVVIFGCQASKAKPQTVFHLRVASLPAFETADMHRWKKLAPLQAGFFVPQTYQRKGGHSQFWYKKNPREYQIDFFRRSKSMLFEHLGCR